MISAGRQCRCSPIVHGAGSVSAANRDAVARYDMDDRQHFDDADRGRIAGLKDQRGPDSGRLIVGAFAPVAERPATP